MVLVFGIDFPLFEFLLILNIIMLAYIVISMFEIRSLIQLRKDFEEFIGKKEKKREPLFPKPEVKQVNREEELKKPEAMS